MQVSPISRLRGRRTVRRVNRLEADLAAVEAELDGLQALREAFRVAFTETGTPVPEGLKDNRPALRLIAGGRP